MQVLIVRRECTREILIKFCGPFLTAIESSNKTQPHDVQRTLCERCTHKSFSEYINVVAVYRCIKVDRMVARKSIWFYSKFWQAQATHTHSAHSCIETTCFFHYDNGSGSSSNKQCLPEPNRTELAYLCLAASCRSNFVIFFASFLFVCAPFGSSSVAACFV